MVDSKSPSIWTSQHRSRFAITGLLALPLLYSLVDVVSRRGRLGPLLGDDHLLQGAIALSWVIHVLVVLAIVLLWLRREDASFGTAIVATSFTVAVTIFVIIEYGFAPPFTFGGLFSAVPLVLAVVLYRRRATADKALPLHRLAVPAVVLGVLGGIGGIVLGHRVRKSVTATPSRGRTMATTGVVLGYALWVPVYLMALYVAWGIAHLSIE